MHFKDARMLLTRNLLYTGITRAKKLLIICGDLNFFYNYNDPNNKFIEIIDYIRTHDHCKIISCKGGNLF